jgi:hypothetical protein
MSNYPTHQQNQQAGQYSTAKDIAFLVVVLCAAILAFLNLPGMLLIALYNHNIRHLDINQCWTFSFCATGGLLIAFRILSGSLESAFKTHLLLSFFDDIILDLPKGILYVFLIGDPDGRLAFFRRTLPR